MSNSLIFSILIVVALTVISFVYTFIRGGTLATPNQLSDKGLPRARRDTAIFFAAISLVVAVIAYFAYQAMYNAAPDSAPTNFLLLAVGVGVVLEVLALIVFRLRGLVDLTLLHILHIVGYGVLLPQLFAK